MFLAGILLGAVFGLVFASYLVKIGRIGGARKAQKSKGLNMTPTKEFSDVVNKNHSANFRTSERPTSDHDAKDEADRLL